MRTLISLGALLLIAACIEKEPVLETVTGQCATDAYTLALPGFEVDTVLVRVFKNDSSFTTPLSIFTDTAAYRAGGAYWGSVPNVFWAVDIDVTKDYEVILPATADTIRIWGLEIEQKTHTYQRWSNSGSHSNYYCLDSLHSRCSLNGSTDSVKCAPHKADNYNYNRSFLFVEKV